MTGWKLILWMIILAGCNQGERDARQTGSAMVCKAPDSRIPGRPMSAGGAGDSAGAMVVAAAGEPAGAVTPESAGILGAHAEAVSGDDSSVMVLIPGGKFEMGSDEFPDSRPVHTVYVHSFRMDEHEVTNAQFGTFVKATGYITVAERPLNPKQYPDVPADRLVAGSAVFSPPSHPVSLDNPLEWWRYVAGANWKAPKGPGSTARGMDPVVQVCYEDAVAYCRWAHKRLPTEAEWEFAARGGLKGKPYYWGAELKPGGKWVANIFQGHFPDHNRVEDGFEGVAPVKSYPPNAYGLYDMEGNVWEWCSDLYRPDYYMHSPAADPKGPGDSYDPDEPGAVKRVQKGGSFLCSDEYCSRYKAGSRGKGEVTSASNNLGFRCVR